MSLFEPIKSASDVMKKIRISSVLSSLLWTLPFLVSALVVTSFTNNITVQTFFMYTTGAVVLVILCSFIGILLFGDKKLLQSEEHTYRMKVLEFLGDQTHTLENFTTSTAENNPTLPNPATAEVLPEPKNKIFETHE